MNWWQILLLCWFCYLVGFLTAALMAAAGRDQRVKDD
jgi:predicted CDP-diglyceride synthetase/phosphatidate cytidylyltransferase